MDVTRSLMNKLYVTLIAASFIAALGIPSTGQDSKTAAPKSTKPPSTVHETQPGREYSGMYSFLKDGEFVQITVEDEGSVTGFLSRYGEAESDKGAFLEQYFRRGKLNGNKITFTTETVQSEWFEFKGTVERGEGKSLVDEAYYILKGTLTDNTSDGAKKVTAHSQAVEFRRFPVEGSTSKN
jgi:hypothetical protein